MNILHPRNYEFFTWRKSSPVEFGGNFTNILITPVPNTQTQLPPNYSTSIPRSFRLVLNASMSSSKLSARSISRRV